MNDDGQLMPDHQRLERLFVTGVLILLFLAVVVRLLGFLIVFNYTTLQMDFSSFYIAGKSVSQGLSPYVNYVESDPGLWDGVTGFTHSRFLYPPLAARPFQLLAWMPYHTAKFIWILSSLIALGAAMIVSFRLSGLRESMRNLLGVGTIVALAYPTLTLLERGQVDGFVLLLILSALIVMKKGTRSSLAAGGLLALATLMKLNCIFLLPFLLLRRRWHAALGFVAGGLLLFGLSLAIDGPDAVSDYAFTQLPRISEYGEGGPAELGLPRESFTEALRGMGAGFSQMDGRPYKRQMFRFVMNASLAQTGAGKLIRSAAERMGISLGPSGTALVLLALFVVLLYLWQRRYGPLGGDDDPPGELGYWQLVMAILLFCGPVTWAMTTVWLLPLSVFLLMQSKDLGGKGETFALLVCTAGLAVVVMPDSYANFMFSPFPREWMDLKYIVAEALIIVGLLWFWRQKSFRPAIGPGEGRL